MRAAPGTEIPLRRAAEIEDDLVVRPTHAGKGDSAPCAPDRPVKMAEEQVSNARKMRGQQLMEGIAAGKPDVVHAWHPHRNGRMVHEQEDRLRIALQFRAQPSLPRGTVLPGARTGCVHVEKQASTERRCGAGLDESFAVPRQIWKYPDEFLRIVVIAGQKVKRHCEATDLGTEGFIAGDVT